MAEERAFGSMMRRLRRARDLTQEALAEQAGCAVATLTAIESGRRRPSRELAAILADRLGVPEAEREAFLRLARGEAAPAAPPQPAGQAGPHQAPPSTQAARFFDLSPELLALRAAAEAPLIGRAAELAEIRTRLAHPSCRLLTIVGPGGVGKTSLAVHAARDLAPAFPDGVAVAPLAAAASGEAALSSIAVLFEGASEGGTGIAARIVAALRPRRQLLVLDNLEQLLADDTLVGLIAAILVEAPGVRLLTTSREPLRLRDEWLYELGGLEVPGEGGLAVAQSAAALLFAERARRLRADFALTPANAGAVTAICRLLNGTPLALELAATWVIALSPAEIAAELARDLDLLATGERDAPVRHRSMRAVFDQSWRLLDPVEQRALARLALFRGGFTREGALAVAGATLPLLAGLIQKSLLRREGERYSLHELIRQFAAEELRHGGDDADAAWAFVAFHRELAAGATGAFLASGRQAGIAQLDAEADNLRAALQLALDYSQGEAGASLCVSLRPIWALRGMLPEGMRWIEQWLAVPGLAPRDRGLLLGASVPLLRLAGDWRRAGAAAEEALGLLRPGEDDFAREAALTGAGLAALDGGDYARARDYLNACVELDRVLGSPFYEAATLSNIGSTYLYEGMLDEARRFYAAGRAGAFAAGAELAVAQATYALGVIDTLEGRPEGLELLQDALPRLDRFGYRLLIAQCFEALAAQWGLRGDHERAGHLYGAATQLRAVHGLAVTPGLQATRRRLEAIARGPFPDDGWARAVAAGRTLDLAQAAAIAVAPADPAPGSD